MSQKRANEPQDEINRLTYALHYWKTLVRRLFDALQVYASPENWKVVYYEGGQARRMWIGPGEGPALAKLAMDGAEGDLKDVADGD